jgi:hypothetical protein
MHPRLLIAVFCLVPGVIHARTDAHGKGPTLFAEVTALDISDDAMTYRLVADFPAAPDPLGRLLRASGQSWTAALGFAQLTDAVDTGTGRLTAQGGQTYLINLGRQWEWWFPAALLSVGAWKPHLQSEAGLHYASASLPAGGTHFQFLLSGGFEWRKTSSSSQDDWALGICWLHYSNANIFSSNAGYDSLVVRIGRSWRW